MDNQASAIITKMRTDQRRLRALRLNGAQEGNKRVVILVTDVEGTRSTFCWEPGQTLGEALALLDARFPERKLL